MLVIYRHYSVNTLFSSALELCNTVINPTTKPLRSASTTAQSWNIVSTNALEFYLLLVVAKHSSDYSPHHRMAAARQCHWQQTIVVTSADDATYARSAL